MSTSVPVVTGATAQSCCGGGEEPGDCAPGEECLPSSFIDPDDCPAGCDPGETCLPDNFIDPDDCPAGCDVLDPTSIEGLVAWYDADDASTFTFTSGIEVDTWADKSGNGNDMVTTNAFGGNPSRVAGAVNGRAAVFSGETFAVDSGSMAAAFALSAPMHLIFVAQWNEPFGDAASPAVGTGGDTWDTWRSGDGDLTVVANGGGHEQGFLAEDVPHIISIAFDNGVNSVYRIDGVEVFAGDLGIAGQTALQFFQNAGGGRALKGYMCEWTTFDRILTDDEQACVEAGLALRWMTGSCPECVCATLEPTLIESDSENFGGGVNTVTTASIAAGTGPYVLLIAGQMEDANGYDVDGCDLAWHTVDEFNPNGDLIHLTAYFGVGTPTTGAITAVPKAGASSNNRAAWMVLDVPGLFSIDAPSEAEFDNTTPVGVAITGDTCEGDITLAFATSGRDLSGALTSWSTDWAPLGEEMLNGVGDVVLGWSATADQNPEASFEESFGSAEAGILGFILRSACGCPSCDACCESVGCDYLPYCFNENADDPETAIATLTPFAYHAITETGAGALADTSGNGNDGTVTGTVAQLGVGLSTKTATALALDTNDGAVSIVSPTGTGLGTDGAEFAIAALLRIDDIGAATNNFPVWLSHDSTGANYDLLVIADGDDTGAHLVNSRNEPICIIRPSWIALGDPFVLVMNGPGDVVYPTGARSTWEFWINGVLVTSGLRRNTGDFANGVKIGQPSDVFFGSPDMAVGAIASFDRALDASEIHLITEAWLDAAMAAAAYTP